MPATEAMREADRAMTVCNACRYCEQYCPVFPAMERRLSFTEADLGFLANLCHNCGECLYACQYAPPHEFAINLPRMLAEVRVQSYEEACWPPALGTAFRQHGVTTSAALALGLSLVTLGLASWTGASPVWPSPPGADFYGVLPHSAMVALFGSVSLFAAAALAAGTGRFWRRVTHGSPPRVSLAHMRQALREAMTLTHLHGGGVDCVGGEESRSPWRRRCHHLTLYGFFICFASTTVAALYHVGFGWHAPYGYTSLPVMLGVIGGAGLIAGPAGLLYLRRTRDPALADPQQHGLDAGFTWLLLMTALTGLALLALREHAVMGVLLVVHLGTVLALFLTLPYGKFVHGLYRTAALAKDVAERAAERTGA